MQRAFEYKLYPTQEQSGIFEDTLETLRHLYNNSLFERIDAYKFEQRSIGSNAQQNRLPTLKKTARLLCDIHSQVVQNCLKRLQLAYENFFRRVEKGTEKPGFPRFKGLGRYRSFTYPQWGTAVYLEGSRLHLSKIGEVTLRLHRPLEGTPKTCTISRKADGWYASVACEVEGIPLPKTGKDVGIDVGIEHFATLTEDHESIKNSRFLKKAQAHLTICQRRLERRSKYEGIGKQRKLCRNQSQRREKARILLAKAHQRVARARRDFHFKVAHALVRMFDTLYVENLNIRGMLKNHHLAKAITDVAWGQFFEILKSMAESAAKIVVEVCPKYTSQNCSGCGKYVPKALSERTHTCPFCGLVLHRDKNGAENVRIVGRTGVPMKIGRDAALACQRSAIAHA